MTVSQLPKTTPESLELATAIHDRGYRTMAVEARNPKYIEVWIQSSYLKADRLIQELGYRQEGSAIVLEQGEEWFMAWVRPK